LSEANQIFDFLKLFIEISPVFGSSLAGAGFAFYLNYRHENKIKKEEEINKSREFMARLYVVAHATLQYTLNYLQEKEISWQDLPAHADLIPDKPVLKVEDIAFCARSEENKGFLSEAYIFELNIERINITLEKHRNLSEEVNKRIEQYIYSQEENKTESDITDFNLEKL